MNAKKSTLKNYTFVLTKFENCLGNIELTDITTGHILLFLTQVSEGAKQSTKKLRYSLLSAFFNFIKDSFDPTLKNPCDSPDLRKIFKEQKPIHWKILEKDIKKEASTHSVYKTDEIRRIITDTTCYKMYINDSSLSKAKDHVFTDMLYCLPDAPPEKVRTALDKLMANAKAVEDSEIIDFLYVVRERFIHLL